MAFTIMVRSYRAIVNNQGSSTEETLTYQCGEKTSKIKGDYDRVELGTFGYSTAGPIPGPKGFSPPGLPGLPRGPSLASDLDSTTP